MRTVSEWRVAAYPVQEEGAARRAWVSRTVECFTIPASKLMSLKYDVAQVCGERTQEYDFNAGIGADT